MSQPVEIEFADVSVDFDGHFQLHDISWKLQSGEHWLVAGPNGAGKSALVAVLSGAGDVCGGTLAGVPPKVSIVSYEAQAELIAAELKKDDADILDVISEGTPVHEIIERDTCDAIVANELVEQFNLTPLLTRAFRKLSTGETRKVMLVRALASKPDLLVLDEPFDGLDANTHLMLKQHLNALVKSIPTVLVLNRIDERPDFITHIGWMEQARLVHSVACSDQPAMAELDQLMHLRAGQVALPEPDPIDRLPALDSAEPLVHISNASIKYSDNLVFQDVSWTIKAGEHWQLTGPNGSGKTCLLALITGDHPQCYVNDIKVFGFQRGSGESIWQIKQFIGYVSTQLQWEYRVSTSLKNVIISGFHDSIGLYSKPTDVQKSIADQWLDILGMRARANDSFTQLSHGDKRLLLIARAMVKHPPLLILDEPCLGLDDMNRRLVLALIEKICASGKTTVLYVNHHAEDKVAGIDNHLALGGTQ